MVNKDMEKMVEWYNLKIEGTIRKPYTKKEREARNMMKYSDMYVNITWC